MSTVKPDEQPLPTPAGWRILIQPIKVDEQTKGGIYLPEDVIKAEEHLQYVGRVVAKGDLCYHHDKFKVHENREPIPWCKVGDYVAYGQYAGQLITVKTEAGLEKYRLINDDEILAVVPDPSSILAYI